LPLAKGKLENGIITCPFHGSSFDVCSGENQDWCNKVGGASLPAWSQKLVALGKKPAPVSVFAVEEKAGKVLVNLP
jgi:nitrite reductase/ring-hydroxylating ferredoxin subunit